MIVVQFTADLRGNKDVLLNGIDIRDPRSQGIIEEKIIEKNLTLDQQWALIMMLRKLSARLEHTYRSSRIRSGEVSTGKVIVSGLKGVPGTNLPNLSGPEYGVNGGK